MLVQLLRAILGFNSSGKNGDIQTGFLDIGRPIMIKDHW
jgi:hypothetical protein